MCLEECVSAGSQPWWCCWRRRRSAFRAPGADAGAGEEPARQLRALRSQAEGPVHRELLRLPGGQKRPVHGRRPRSRRPCADPLFCAAYRAPWAEALGAQRHVHRQHLLARPLPVGRLPRPQRPRARLHPREVLHRDQPEAQARPDARLTAASPAPSTRPPPRRASSSATSPRPSSTDTRDFLLAYELQRRFFVRDDVGQIAEGPRPGGAHQPGRPDVQAAARRRPQPALGRPDPAARRLPRQAAAGRRSARRSTS